MQLCPDRVPAFAISEIALLASLTSADKGVAQLAAQSLRVIAQAERQANAPTNPGMSPEERSRRHPVYERMGDPNVIVVGKSDR
jgi:neurofibromin 1